MQSQKILSLCALYPNLKWPIMIVGHWGYVSFYIAAELWGNMILALLFWQFANQIITYEEAKRFYPMFGLVGNCALLMVAAILNILLNQDRHLTYDCTKFVPVLCTTIISGTIILFLYHWVNNKVIASTAIFNTKLDATKKSLTMRESSKMILSSKDLILLAILIISYGMSINLVEGVWKSKIKEMYPTKESYILYMSTFQAYQGVVAIIFSFIGSNVLRSLSWKSAAMFTPIMMLFTGSIFFASIIFFEKFSTFEIATFIGTGPLFLVILVGSIQNILTKATKYSLFDSTKEMVYLHLNNELQTKGRAAVEVATSRGGKSLGGIIQSTFFILFPTATFENATPFFAIMFFIILGIWLQAIRILNSKISKNPDQYRT